MSWTTAAGLRRGALAALAWAALAADGAQAGQGTAVIHAIDAGASVVVLDQQAYQVTDDTVLEGPGGESLALAELPSLEGGASLDDSAAWIEAEDPGTGTPRLYRLRLTGAAPK